MSAYFMRGEGFLSWVAEKSDKRVIGFLEASIREVAEGCDTRNVGYIEGWYVEPDFRRTGVGRLLVSHAAQWARAQGLQGNGLRLRAGERNQFEGPSRAWGLKKPRA